MTAMTTRAHSANPDSGVYRLTIELARPVRIRVGALGLREFPAGRYVYCGSAQRTLAARIARHRRKGKPKRWHIDYLLAHRAARVVDVEIFAGGKDGECRLVAQSRLAGGRVVVKGFGASDCPRKNVCGTHLLWMGDVEP